MVPIDQTFVGLDTSKLRNAAAIAESGRGGRCVISARPTTPRAAHTKRSVADHEFVTRTRSYREYALFNAQSYEPDFGDRKLLVSSSPCALRKKSPWYDR